jgi:hypothetical protein
VGNMKFNTQNKQWINIHIIVCIILPVYLYVHYVQEK